LSTTDEREPWRDIFEPAATGRYFFHYTRLSSAIEGILPKLRLRFSRFSSMRDPRETQWAFATVFTGFEDEDSEPDRLSATLWGTLEHAREDVRILSLTEDDNASNDIFGRGFARPRLWEQYAGNHVGSCLCLERSALEAAIADSVSAVGGRVFQRSVDYRDAEIGLHASQFDLNRARGRDADQVIHEHMEEHVDELFFTKLTDWRSESEYRFVTFWRSPEELFVDVSKALKAVLLGHQVKREYAPALYALCEPRDIGVAKVWWQNGRPWIHRAARNPKLE
jgi:Protein of unknown function (DUF2971)